MKAAVDNPPRVPAVSYEAALLARQRFHQLAGLDDPDSELAVSRIAIPVRGLHCTHTQCFDYQSWLRCPALQRKGKCPICLNPLGTLVRDVFFEALLRSTPLDSDDEIEYSSSVLTSSTPPHPPPANATNPAPTPLAAVAASPGPDVVVLDDDEPPPAAARPHPHSGRHSPRTAVAAHSQGWIRNRPPPCLAPAAPTGQSHFARRAMALSMSPDQPIPHVVTIDLDLDEEQAPEEEAGEEDDSSDASAALEEAQDKAEESPTPAMPLPPQAASTAPPAEAPADAPPAPGRPTLGLLVDLTSFPGCEPQDRSTLAAAAVLPFARPKAAGPPPPPGTEVIDLTSEGDSEEDAAAAKSGDATGTDSDSRSTSADDDESRHHHWRRTSGWWDDRPGGWSEYDPFSAGAALDRAQWWSDHMPAYWAPPSDDEPSLPPPPPPPPPPPMPHAAAMRSARLTSADLHSLLRVEAHQQQQRRLSAGRGPHLHLIDPALPQIRPRPASGLSSVSPGNPLTLPQELRAPSGPVAPTPGSVASTLAQQRAELARRMQITQTRRTLARQQQQQQGSGGRPTTHVRAGAAGETTTFAARQAMERLRATAPGAPGRGMTWGGSGIRLYLAGAGRPVTAPGSQGLTPPDELR
ncbi:hypothetical protein PAPYR_645 [Paratrimastix pyriformis]|uniref:SP-RING-type domain-containing protein n=1 Tax=Paratrimastix pyriformis TaxID=342808 RepID=A0ABQ8UXZ7_9EUKA|nr:hypothetical protein PAPYR_645 [Paratrimastix pyriformis]